MEFIILKALEYGALPIALIIMSWLISRYLKPYLDKTGNLAKAQEIAIIADRITDELIIAMPNATWAVYADKAVDRLVDALGEPSEKIQEIAIREVNKQLKDKLGKHDNLE